MGRSECYLLYDLSKRQQFYYIVGILWLYPSTLAKVQLILRNSGIGVLLIIFTTLQILPWNLLNIGSDKIISIVPCFLNFYLIAVYKSQINIY